MGRRILAWLAHLYTALGLIAAAGMVAAVLAVPPCFVLAFWLMFGAMVIDGTDGTLARLVQVKKVLPGFDGRRLDDLIDFQTYTAVPLLLIWRAGLVSPEHAWVLLVPLLASAYGFCQTSVKTESGFFVGFPSYWNVVALYLFVLQPLPEGLVVGVLLFFAALTFIPCLYLYPTQRGFLNRLALVLSIPWAALLAYILWSLPAQPPGRLAGDDLRVLALASLLYPSFYLVVSWAISARIWLTHAFSKRG
jgi:phosphatidylcholine synthase